MKSPRSQWKLQDAKARFSELFRQTLAEGPQLVTRQSGGEVVVLSRAEYDRLTGRHKQPDLYEYLRNSPLVGSGVKFE
ncbi:MAG: type II toxin-antitoxin system prevent-host-death family antitoxin [Bryobacterales bacterium]|nr:type II toxin-antitoxin system prevent-host-death family antitoxin [Bryobacterales bacterium]